MQKPESFSDQNESFQGIIFLLFHIQHSSLNAKNRASTALGHRHYSNESDGLGYARPGAQTERSRGHFHSREKSVPERSRGGGDSIPTNILASTALGHRHHSDEGIGLGFARPGVVPERSRGAFSSAKKSVPERSRGRSPSEVEGICPANDDNSFSFHRNIATKQIAIFECLQFTTLFKYNK
jgi:hypothetical protein